MASRPPAKAPAPGVNPSPHAQGRGTSDSGGVSQCLAPYLEEGEISTESAIDPQLPPPLLNSLPIDNYMPNGSLNQQGPWRDLFESNLLSQGEGFSICHSSATFVD
ncbi:hypothetical protein NE237_015939 [Protea cynaroides]|uniref:Uncharacterized protein n=1 Tax=Protea cynaroides TaxID=273540 RepID=A0A9Q0QRK2_9MAGN|nr:hypothetical protein NE237_015939 [Protea cynaroides]